MSLRSKTAPPPVCDPGPMDADLATLRAFFARAPFMVDLGIEPFDM